MIYPNSKKDTMTRWTWWGKNEFDATIKRADL
jgi:hypothetical protein